VEAAINDGEPTAQAAQRLRASELLPAAHVIRSIALMDLFVLALLVATPLTCVSRRPLQSCPTGPKWSAQPLLAAKRSSIKSRSTSQYLSDDRRSLSVPSVSAGSSPFMILGRHPFERLLDGGDLPLDFGVRQPLRSFRALPINNPPS